jgi:hypothetical protein
VYQRSNTQVGHRVLSDFTLKIVRPNCVHRDILIFTSSALKTWVLHVNTFYSWILLYISPVTAVNISILSVPLYITHLLQLYPCEHSRINILQWILTKLGTYRSLQVYQRSYSQVGHRVLSQLRW